jgi:hypothetical protein
MTLLICTITVIVNMGGFGAESQATLKGSMLADNGSSYLVDFTKGIKEKKLDLLGDYDTVQVEKKNCFKVSK